MSDFVEVKTAELIGAVLDWAVAKATGAVDLKVTEAGSVCCIYEMSCGSGCWTGYYEPSTDWSQGGPLIEKHHIDLTLECKDLIYASLCDDSGMPVMPGDVNGAFGPTYLIAACRAIVASVLGETVSVPR